MEGGFDPAVFLTGFFGNAVLAAALTYIGDRTGVELYLAAVFALGTRIFMNLGAIKSTHFDGEMYEELKEIYDMIMRKNTFSPNEMQAIAEELGNLRKR